MAGLLQQPGQPQEGVPEEPMPEEGMEEDVEIDENNPQFQQMLQIIGRGLYENKAADKLAKALKAAPNKQKTLANAAYDMIDLSADKMDGELPPELLSLLAITALNEISEIAETAGVEISPTEVADALKMMILRFVGEMGHDTTELQAAMDQVDPSAFTEEQPPTEQPSPQQGAPMQ